MVIRVFKFLQSTIALVFLWSGVPTVAISEGIFPDKALDAAVRREVFAKRNNQAPLTLDDLTKVSRLVGKGKNIQSLEGLQHCPFLLDVDLENNQISDCSPLQSLKFIQKLTLAGNKIDSIEHLKGLTSLQYLDISRNNVEDLEPIRGMQSLRSIYFEENKIRSLAPLEPCKNLWSIYGSKNPIENFSALSTLSNVDTLHLNQTGLSNLASTGLSERAVEKGHTKLKNLVLRDNLISDLSLLVNIGESQKAARNAGPPFQPPKRLIGLKIDVTGNPLTEAAKIDQLPRLTKLLIQVEFTKK
jgi:Leucine-rich repeat (LRR) protein